MQKRPASVINQQIGHGACPAQRHSWPFARSSLTTVALDPTGRQLGARRFPVNAGTLRAVLAGWPQRQFAVEGAHGLGRGIAQQLTAAGAHVLDVSATLAARVRLLTTGGGRKTDTHDAHAVALRGARSRPGSLTSGNCGSDMIPACRRGCCT